MKNFFLKNIGVSAAFPFLVTCSSKTETEYHEGNRDKVIDCSSLMVSIDDKLPPIHSFATPIIAGDTLIILDYRSTDFLFTAYDIYNDTTIGRFGKYGIGPGEAGNPLLEFYNKYDKNLYLGNGIRGKISSFYLPDAVSDSTYKAVDRFPVDFYIGILSPNVIDKSTVLCTTWSDVTARGSVLSKMNLDTGEISNMDSVPWDNRTVVGLAASVKDNIVFALDRQA